MTLQYKDSNLIQTGNAQKQNKHVQFIGFY